MQLTPECSFSTILISSSKSTSSSSCPITVVEISDEATENFSLVRLARGKRAEDLYVPNRMLTSVPFDWLRFLNKLGGSVMETGAVVIVTLFISCEETVLDKSEITHS